jgi:peptidyl-prolyl cis-trans isomerase B (cyclophilin B)
VAGKNERQRRQARERYRRQQEERYARQRKMRRRGLVGAGAVLAAALIASLLVVFLPGGSPKHPAASASKSATPSPTATATPTATAVAEPAHNCSYTAVSGSTPAARKVSFPPTAPDYTASYQATLNTNLGKITFNLLNSKATCTVNSFVHLAEAGYFNNSQCHRLVTTGPYVLQCGDPYATATTKLNCSSSSKIGEGTPGYEFASENLTKATYPAGTVAMANATGNADSNGSQFFIVYQDSTSALTASYPPFAAVSSGLGIVQNVAKDGYSCQYASSGGGVPKKKVIIDSVTIKKT